MRSGEHLTLISKLPISTGCVLYLTSRHLLRPEQSLPSVSRPRQRGVAWFRDPWTLCAFLGEEQQTNIFLFGEDDDRAGDRHQHLEKQQEAAT